MIDLTDADGVLLGLSVEAFKVGGKIPLYQETSNDIAKLSSNDAVIGLGVTSTEGKRLYFIPGCNAVTDDIRNRIEGADVVFFDGTLWQDDEMIRAEMGTKTGQRMGHLSISGENGSIASLASTKLRKKIFIHINNTNPVLCDDSAEAAFVRAQGWDIAYDGMEVTL
jgi:pyrroloquinoline quinone biosynthesis protein B